MPRLSTNSRPINRSIYRPPLSQPSIYRPSSTLKQPFINTSIYRPPTAPIIGSQGLEPLPGVGTDYPALHQAGIRAGELSWVKGDAFPIVTAMEEDETPQCDNIRPPTPTAVSDTPTIKPAHDNGKPHSEPLVLSKLLGIESVVDYDRNCISMLSTQCSIKGNIGDMIIDNGVCENAVPTKAVDRLEPEVTPHLYPYTLTWLNDKQGVRVTRQRLVPFSNGTYIDEAICDIVPMDVCHSLLGRPWYSDLGMCFEGRGMSYSFDKGAAYSKLFPLLPDSFVGDREWGLTSLLSTENKGQIVCDLSYSVPQELLGKEGLKALPISPIVQPLFEKFQPVFPTTLPQGLPPMRSTQHRIEFALVDNQSAKLPQSCARAPAHSNPSALPGIPIAITLVPDPGSSFWPWDSAHAHSDAPLIAPPATHAILPPDPLTWAIDPWRNVSHSVLAVPQALIYNAPSNVHGYLKSVNLSLLGKLSGDSSASSYAIRVTSQPWEPNPRPLPKSSSSVLRDWLYGKISRVQPSQPPDKAASYIPTRPLSSPHKIYVSNPVSLIGAAFVDYLAKTSRDDEGLKAGEIDGGPSSRFYSLDPILAVSLDPEPVLEKPSGPASKQIQMELAWASWKGKKIMKMLVLALVENHIAGMEEFLKTVGPGQRVPGSVPVCIVEAGQGLNGPQFGNGKKCWKANKYKIPPAQDLAAFPPLSYLDGQLKPD